MLVNLVGIRYDEASCFPAVMVDSVRCRLARSPVVQGRLHQHRLHGPHNLGAQFIDRAAHGCDSRFVTLPLYGLGEGRLAANRNTGPSFAWTVQIALSQIVLSGIGSNRVTCTVIL